MLNMLTDFLFHDLKMLSRRLTPPGLYNNLISGSEPYTGSRRNAAALEMGVHRVQRVKM